VSLNRRELLGLVPAAGLALLADPTKLLASKGEALPSDDLMREYKNHIAIKEGVAARWARTGLLDGIECPHLAREMGVLLENQRLFNETLEDDDDLHMPAKVKRISIPLVRRGYVHPLLTTLAPIVAMMGPSGPTYWWQDGKIVTGAGVGMPKQTLLGPVPADHTVPGTAKLRSVLEISDGDDVAWNDLSPEESRARMNAEANMTAIIAQMNAWDMIEATVKACRQVAGTTHKGDDAQLLVRLAGNHLKAIYPTGMNWVVASQDFALDLYSKVDDACRRVFHVEPPEGMSPDEFIARLREQFRKAKAEGYRQVERYYKYGEKVEGADLWVDREAEGWWAVAGAFPGSVLPGPADLRMLYAGLQFCPYVPISTTGMRIAGLNESKGIRYSFYTRYGWGYHPNAASFFVNMQKG